VPRISIQSESQLTTMNVSFGRLMSKSYLILALAHRRNELPWRAASARRLAFLGLRVLRHRASGNVVPGCHRAA